MIYLEEDIPESRKMRTHQSIGKLISIELLLCACIVLITGTMSWILQQRPLLWLLLLPIAPSIAWIAIAITMFMHEWSRRKRHLMILLSVCITTIYFIELFLFIMGIGSIA